MQVRARPLRRPQSGGAAERLIWTVLGLALVVTFTLGAWSFLFDRRTEQADGPEELPVLGLVPDFRLTERSGSAVSRSDLGGSPWVADFIFTRCGSLCPLLTSRMARLQTALGAAVEEVRLVSFSVDPGHDTPEVLRVYAERFHAHPTSWLFLTGERDALYSLIGSGFHLAVQERPADSSDDVADLIAHSDRFVLVDARFRIRGYYAATEEEGFSALLRDLDILRKER